MKTITNISELDFSKIYSYADYLKWQFDERIEIIKGKILEMSAPSIKHQEVSVNLTGIFRTTFHKHPCKLFHAPFDVRLVNKKKSTSDKQVHTVVQPDLCVICDLEKLKDGRGCLGSPDLVIEILSPGNSTREMKTKFDLYEENEIQEYWLVEPLQESILIYVLKEGKYIGLRPFTIEDIISSPTFPSLKIAVKEVFE
jgi:Uma2 family endonuclease